MKFEFDEGVMLKVDRVPNAKNDECHVDATSNTALLKGLCWLMKESAKYMGMTIHELICRLAVILTVPERKGQNDGKADV